jgi:pyridinium-3,5-bisthiocarboxylic acid mononucleotide nickel chelatase
MKTLYFDCFAGASGDMILGAMVSAGVDPRALSEQLGLLSVQGFAVDFATVNRSGISATYARVQTAHEHAHRHLGDILKIISESRLSETVKERAGKIFSLLAAAEAHVHNEPIDHVHFHEVGALDAIVDVVGAAICFDLLGIERFVCSPLHVGSGTVDMAHGRFPVPPPAVTELLKHAPVYATDIKGELVTPTGAAIIATVCAEFGPLPKMSISDTGYGAGTREYEKFPNVLRVIIGEDAADDSSAPAGEQLWMLETNIDDLSPQVLGHVMDRAFDLGALDCYFTPIQMKKNRPAVLLSILCRSNEKEKLSQLVFLETTTLGLRSYAVRRQALERETARVETPYGPIDVKVARLNDRESKSMPEYEQCRAAARRANVPLRVVEDEARSAFAALNGGKKS